MRSISEAEAALEEDDGEGDSAALTSRVLMNNYSWWLLTARRNPPGCKSSGYGRCGDGARPRRAGGGGGHCVADRAPRGGARNRVGRRVELAPRDEPLRTPISSLCSFDTPRQRHVADDTHSRTSAATPHTTTAGKKECSHSRPCAALAASFSSHILFDASSGLSHLLLLTSDGKLLMRVW